MTEWIVSSCALILVVVLLRQLLKGKLSLRLQYALWALVLIRLLVPFSFGASRFSITNAVGEVPLRQETEITIADPPSKWLNTEWVPQSAVAEPDPSLPEEEREQQYLENKQQWQEEQDAAWEEYKAENTKYVTFSVSDILRIVWIAGMAVMSLWLLISNVRFWLRLRRSRDILKCSLPPVYVTGAVETPCLFGLVKPKIYVTPEVAADKVAMGHVLAHEETHYRHRDYIWAVLRCVCLVLHWYNPLVWLAAALSRRDAELACDEGTLRRIGEGERAAYGRTLIGLTCTRKGGLLQTATTMTGSRKSIKERIVLIARKPKMKVYTLIAVILIAAIAVGCTYTGKPKEPEEGFVEWVETLEDETWSQTVRFGELQEEQCTKLLLPILRGIAEDDFLDEPVDDSELRSQYYLYAKGIARERTTGEWSFYCLKDGTVYVSANYDIAKRYNFKEPRKLNCPELYDFIVTHVDLYRGVEPEADVEDAVQKYADEVMVEHLAEVKTQYADPEKLICWTRQDGLVLLNTGTAGNDFAVQVYQLDYTMKVEETETAYTRYLFFGCAGSDTCIPIGAADLQTLKDRYDTPEMQEKYGGNLYVAAAMELYQQYLAEQQIMPIDPVENADLEEKIRFVVNHILVGSLSYDESWQSPGSYTVTVTGSDGSAHRYAAEPRKYFSLSSTPGYILVEGSEWTQTEAPGDLLPPEGEWSICIENDRYSLTVWSHEDLLMLTVDGETLWLKGQNEQYKEPVLFNRMFQYAMEAEYDALLSHCRVDGTETDLEVVAQKLMEQYAQLLTARPGWIKGQVDYAWAGEVEVFDAYYGEDRPNFCFSSTVYLKMSPEESIYWQSGAGLTEPASDGPYAGYYGCGREAVAQKGADGNWHLRGFASGGSMAVLPAAAHDESTTAEQLVEWYFLTEGWTHDHIIPLCLAEKPLEEVQAQLNRLEETQRQELLKGLRTLAEKHPEYFTSWSVDDL